MEKPSSINSNQISYTELPPTTDLENSSDPVMTVIAKGPSMNPVIRRATKHPSSPLDQTTPIPYHFGPKTKSFILQAKQFDQPQTELDHLEDYKFWSDLGRGSYATVKFATQLASNLKVAVKIYDKKKLDDPLRVKSLNDEIKILKRINHPNIVQLLETIEKEKNIYLVLEYIKGISLQAFLQKKTSKRLEESDAVGIFTQFMRGLAYCHSLLVAHRDIKLENVLITEEGVVKIIDFGFATICERGNKDYMYCGTPNYMSPEIVKKVEYEGLPVDIWAAGVLLYLLVTGAFPFGSNKESKVFKRILSYDLVIPEWLSDNCKDLIREMLEENPEKRITADKVLGHRWIVMKGSVIFKTLPSCGDVEEVYCEDL